MAIVRLFASAREAAGLGRDELPGANVAEVLAAATDRYGPGFAAVLGTCRVWVNGEAVPDDARHATVVGTADEVAVLPPVSGGAPEADRLRRHRSPGRASQADPSPVHPSPAVTSTDRRGLVGPASARPASSGQSSEERHRG